MAHHRALGTDVAIVRIFNTYGPRLRPDDGRVVSNFLLQAMRGEPLTVYGDGSQTRSLCYVEDEVRGLLALFDSAADRPGQHRQSRRVHRARAGPARSSSCSARSSTIIHLPLPVDDPTRRRPDITVARRAAGLGADHRLEEGLARTAAYLAEDAGLPERRPGAGRGPGGPVTWSEWLRTPADGATEETDTMPDVGSTDRCVGDARRRGRYARLLSVIVPVFNERITVAEVIRRIRAVELPVRPRGHRGRRRVVGRHRQGAGRPGRLDRAGDHPRASTRARGRPSGPAWSRCAATSCSIQDADLEYDPEDWPKLLEPILRGKAQVVYGSRFTGERKNMMPLHWIGNRFLSLVTNVLYSSTLSDMETCYKLFDRRVLEGITIESDRFDFEPEITAKVLRRGYRIYEVPISYAGREADEGKKITWRDGFGALAALVKYRFTRLDA